MEYKYRIKINLQSGEIEVEGDKEFVKKEIIELLEKLETKYIPEKNVQAVSEQSDETKELLETEKQKIYIKDFVVQKDPKNAQEAIVVMAYYLSKFENKETFSAEDLKTLWTASGVKVKPPKKMNQAIIDAKNRHGWFDRVKTKIYKINEHGIYFVENELPKKKK